MLSLRSILVNVLNVDKWIAITRKAEGRTLNTLTQQKFNGDIGVTKNCSAEEYNELKLNALEQAVTILYSVKRPDEMIYIKITETAPDRTSLAFKVPDDYVVVRGNVKEIAPESQLGEIIQGKMDRVELLEWIRTKAAAISDCCYFDRANNDPRMLTKTEVDKKTLRIEKLTDEIINAIVEGRIKERAGV